MIQDYTRYLTLSFYAWEQRKLGKVIERKTQKRESSDLPYIEYADIIPNIGRLNKDIFSRKNTKQGIYFQKNDILFGKLRPYLNNWLKPQFKGIAVGDFWVFNGIKLNNDFLYYYIQTKKFSDVANATTGTKMPRSDWKLVSNLKIKFPSFEEQQNIGKLLYSLEKLITLYERKFKLLSQVKKYFLNNLFTKKEYPNLRFKGYEDTWLKSKFSKFLSIPEKVKVTIDSPSRILTVKLNLGGVQKGANRTTLKLNSTTYYLRKAGQLIYGKQNLFNGSLAIIPSQFEGYVTSGDVPSLNINNINKQFLYYYIARRSFYKKTEAYSSGTGSKRIHEKTFLSFNIVYPENLKEQEKISRLISSINSNIKLYCSKKNKLTAIKKKLLNTMFI
ncbi:restriction endonuclease subunit S [Ligilactobacillus hohenheimensis]|uniref:restriction endonuclease subunit S n=1 Tax=Ligilactobacillus hohenheimensis TaxID=2991832 RepID=UPI002DD630C4|nr:restriction endonuclease subunit S [Ligilactobacillus hohenheimensis]